MGALVTPLRLLVDTNVWLDYFLARTPGHREAAELVGAAAGSEAVALYTSSLSTKDIAYLLERDMKAGARAAGVEVTEQVAAAAREAAWGCVRLVTERSLIVPVGHSEVLQAFALKAAHDDFEDDLLLGSAYRAEVDYVVTYDARLAQRSPVPCASVGEALEIVRRALATPSPAGRGSRGSRASAP